MKTGIVLLGLLVTTPLFASGMSMFHRDAEVHLSGKLNCPLIASSGGTVYLQMTLTTSGTRKPESRRPLNLSVVLDRSGSMADQQKMEYAKSALRKLVTNLEEQDIFSLVVYDDEIQVLFPARRVGRDRHELARLVDAIYPRNSTNLGGGMMEGLRQVERHCDREFVNRVILLSDGLANRGITSPQELNRIGRRYRNRSISLTTMGVGLDYNENLMVGLAESGGGNYYFIESPSQLAGIIGREFNCAATVLAQNAVIVLKPAPGVRIVDAIGCEHAVSDGTFRIAVGDVYANESRSFTVALGIPEGSGRRAVVTGEFFFEGKLSGTTDFSAGVQYTKDVASVEKHRDLDVQSSVDVALSTRRVENAMQALDAGKVEEAKAELETARAHLVASPASSASGTAAGAIQDQAERLDRYSRVLQEANARQAKKSIQYENYKVQKKRQE